jgi:hypothetical protein
MSTTKPNWLKELDDLVAVLDAHGCTAFETHIHGSGDECNGIDEDASIPDAAIGIVESWVREHTDYNPNNEGSTGYIRYEDGVLAWAIAPYDDDTGGVPETVYVSSRVASGQRVRQQVFGVTLDQRTAYCPTGSHADAVYAALQELVPERKYDILRTEAHWFAAEPGKKYDAPTHVLER